MTTIQTRGNVAGFEMHLGGRVYGIRRDVCHEHPGCVHAAMGTANEIELQQCLDGIYYDDFFAADGTYLGCDENGLGLRFED